MQSYPPAPVGGTLPGNVREAASQGWVRQVADVLNNALRGKLNCTGEVTLAPGAASTTLIDPRIGAFSTILLSPLTANAAGVAWWVSARTTGEATIAHPVSAAVDRTYSVAILG